MYYDYSHTVQDADEAAADEVDDDDLDDWDDMNEEGEEDNDRTLNAVPIVQAAIQFWIQCAQFSYW